jgi:hypothetical protein
MSEVAPEHQHVYVKARVLDAHGKPMLHGRRCRCGLEVIGGGGGAEGVFPVDANLIRAGQKFNAGVVDFFERFGRAMEQSRRRRFP